MHKNNIAKLILLAVVGAGLFVGLRLVGQQQLIDKEAATPSGTVVMSLSPASQTLNIDQEQTVTVQINTGAAQIRGYQAYLSFTYSGSQSPISILGTTATTTNSELSQCLVNSINHDSGAKRYVVSVSCLLPIGSSTPFSTAGQTSGLFTFNIKGQTQGSINLDFDSTITKATDFNSAEDILAIPAGGVFTVGAGSATNTPTPTQEVAATSTPTTIPTNTPTTSQSQSTPTPTTQQGGTNPTNTPVPTGAPNSCGGSCGSNSNCDPSLICWYGNCRNPYCVNTASCNCSQPTNTPTARPSSSSFVPTPTTEIVYYQSPTPETPYTEINPFLGGPNDANSPDVPPIEYAEDEGAEKLGFFARIIRAITNFFQKLFGQS